LKPLAEVRLGGGEKTDFWPALAVRDRIVPAAETTVLSEFSDKTGPALVHRELGKGQVFYAAALPGVASLWSGLQPPIVPDRGPATHSVPEHWDKGVSGLLAFLLVASKSPPLIQADPELIDARILKAPAGYVVPIANYHDKVGQPVKLRLLLKGVKKAS